MRYRYTQGELLLTYTSFLLSLHVLDGYWYEGLTAREISIQWLITVRNNFNCIGTLLILLVSPCLFRDTCELNVPSLTHN